MANSYRLNEYKRSLQKDESEIVVAEKALIPGGLSMIVFLIFMTLKLMEEITWSWWWVTSPLWIPYALVAVRVVVLLVVLAIQHIIRSIRGVFKLGSSN
jgi:membrane protein YdbS with pleckstrin-like domain